MKFLNWLATALLVLGGINWGLIGIFDINLATVIFDGTAVTPRIIYIIIGMAAIYCLYLGAKRHF